ncbi:hypothetical protein PENSPDRAFT_321356 [Peniophora sp. CONT]|nr:hypothetical protein PENSPDRAFT_321356 [Peniophora sp. CONT]
MSTSDAPETRCKYGNVAAFQRHYKPKGAWPPPRVSGCTTLIAVPSAFPPVTSQQSTNALPHLHPKLHSGMSTMIILSVRLISLTLPILHRRRVRRISTQSI